MGLSLLHVPGNKWMNPSIPPISPEWDWLKPEAT